MVGSDKKLFFLLTYLKRNSLQHHQAASFSVSQTQVSRLATGVAGRVEPGAGPARAAARVR
ncbi:MAG: transposase family protein [Hymenobacter sp.]|nr:MAG: transposase family protein [Hymenobacter sp.]